MLSENFSENGVEQRLIICTVLMMLTATDNTVTRKLEITLAQSKDDHLEYFVGF